jgi:phage/plasmid-associated DNA primase
MADTFDLIRGQLREAAELDAAREREMLKRCGSVVTPEGVHLPERLEDPFRLFALRTAAEHAGDDLSRGTGYAIFTREQQAWLADRSRWTFYSTSGCWVEDTSKEQLRAEAAANVLVEQLLGVALGWAIEQVDEELDWLEQQLDALPTGPEAAAHEAQAAEYRERRSRLEERRNAFAKQRKDLRSRKARQNMVADSRPMLALCGEDFDREDHKLNTPAGVLDLETGELREGHYPSDRMTRITAANFDPKATHPEFERLVEGLTLGRDGKPDPELRRYLQTLLGSMLIGRSELRMLTVLTGPPRTMKSTLLRILRTAAGGYIGTMDPAGLASRGADGQGGSNTLTPELEALVGRRGVVVDELPDGWRPSVDLLKRLTGSDTLTINPKHRQPYEVRMTASLVIATNGTVRLPPGEAAAWERLYFVDLRHARQMDRASMDTGAQDRLAADPGVLAAALAFLVEGAVMLLRNGGSVSPPASADVIREEMRRGSNALHEALELEVLELDGGAVTATDELVRALADYAREAGRPGSWVPNVRRLGDDLKALGCSNETAAGGVLRVSAAGGRRLKAWRGIRLGPASTRRGIAPSDGGEPGL